MGHFGQGPRALGVHTTLSWEGYLEGGSWGNQTLALPFSFPDGMQSPLSPCFSSPQSHPPHTTYTPPYSLKCSLTLMIPRSFSKKTVPHTHAASLMLKGLWGWGTEEVNQRPSQSTEVEREPESIVLGLGVGHVRWLQDLYECV